MWKIKPLLALLLILSLTSCQEKNENTTFWGETEYYSDFLFCKYEPVRMGKKIKLEFNENARQVEGVRLGLFEKGEQENYKLVKEDILLYKNGEVCPDNTFTLSGKEQEATIEIEFTPKARFGTHKWYVKIINTGGLDRVNDSELADDPTPLILEWRAKKIDAWNPLKLILCWILGILVGLFVLWMLILRNYFYPRFKVGGFTVIDPYYSMRKLRGCYKLVCTNKPVRQSALSRFFIGRIMYEVNPFWTKDWVIIPRDRSSVKPVANREYSFEPYTVSLKKGTEYKVTHNVTGDNITLMIN